MELKDYRKQLDEIDGKLLSLFAERMNIVAEIARWKQENHFPVLDSGREEEKLRITGRHDPCIVPRAVPVVEAVAAIAVADLILEG